METKGVSASSGAKSLGPLTDDPNVRYDGRLLTIEDTVRDEQKAYSDKKRQTAKRQRHRSQQVDADTEFTWLAQLLRPDNRKVVCLAILISPQHLITQKRCFAEAKLA
ncbi:hypothetical protein AAVH_16412 [Aphelenchoides avenae]|nr:hypothetical protein AAVH_16412 [Aphelenchus avenae]